MESAEKRRHRRIALWAGIVAKPRREPGERKGARVVRWIGARARRKQTTREEVRSPTADGDNVIVLKWSDTMGRPDRASLFRRLTLAPVIAFPGRMAALPASP